MEKPCRLPGYQTARPWAERTASIFRGRARRSSLPCAHGCLRAWSPARLTDRRRGLLEAPRRRHRGHGNARERDRERDQRIASAGEDAGRIGADLPNAPETTGSAYAQYRWPLAALGDGIARFDFQHVGKQAIELIPATGDTAPFYLDAYDIGRFQIGVENERWAAFLYADNLFDERAETSKVRLNPPGTVEERYSLIRPRTVGLRFSMSL